jgi:FkbM family methyltransferase
MHMKKVIPEWLQREVAEYDLDLTPPPTTILDIGANIGAFALHYAAKWPAALITCVEPIDANVAILEKNTQDIKVSILNVALREKSGWGEMYLGENNATHSFFQRGRQTDKKEAVDILNAGSLASAQLVKIDTEGCELEIVQHLDFRQTRAVVVEYHSAEDKKQIHATLTDSGFKCIQLFSHDENFGVMKFAKDDGVTVPQPKPAPHRKVFVACAAHFSNFDVAFLQSLLTLAIRPPCPIEIAQPCTDPSVERARNILTANFLAGDCTHLLFVDADIAFTPADVARISSHAEPVVGGMYPLKTPSPAVQWCGNGFTAEAAVREDGLSLVKYIGTGFLCIHRSAFEKIIASGAVEKYRQDFPPFREEFAFWTQGVRDDGAGGPKRFLTEDWMFCQRWNELGGQIYVDAQVVLRHVGRAVYPLPLQTGHPFVKNEAASYLEKK